MKTLNFTDLVNQRMIYLSGKFLTDNQVDLFVGVLKESNILQNLHLSRSNLTLTDGKLTDALASNTTLQELILRDNKIGVDGAKHLADALKVNNTSEKLRLYGNKICDEGTLYNNTLKELRLYGNKICDEGTKHVADLLKENESLEIIGLEENNISDEGAKHLADALKVNKTLKELWLNGNKIGDEGAKHIADALKENESLELIVLSRNNIGDEGAKSIAGCLYKNQRLRCVHLCNNNIGDDGAKKLAEALRWNYGIKRLEISSNPVSTHITTEIKEVLNGPSRKVPNAQARHLHEVIASKDKTIALKNNLIATKDHELMIYLKEKCGSIKANNELNSTKDEMEAVEASLNDTRGVKVKKEAYDAADDFYNAVQGMKQEQRDTDDEAENPEKKKQKIERRESLFAENENLQKPSSKGQTS